jgi:hypothetical protein
MNEASYDPGDDLYLQQGRVAESYEPCADIMYIAPVREVWLDADELLVSWQMCPEARTTLSYSCGNGTSKTLTASNYRGERTYYVSNCSGGISGSVRATSRYGVTNTRSF